MDSPATAIFARWDGVLRGKASDYEHKARANGQEVTQPSIDGICNEMTAFLAGLATRSFKK